MKQFIPFNKPGIVGQELAYIQDAVMRGHLSGNGFYSKKCQKWFEDKYGFGKCLLTTSCTDALEMCGLLLNLKPGDEVIMPSYTFVSTANAFVLRGAEIVFVDSQQEHPNMDVDAVEKAITKHTKAIVAVHYAGFPCDMERLSALAKKHNLVLIEDAAQAIDVEYMGKYLGAWGDLATFSFHETKNIQCGEGGMLVVNNERFFDRAEILWEKGTNRQAFFRGQVDKYRWVDLGSSFLLSELNAAYLAGQIERITRVQEKRKAIVAWYMQGLMPLHVAGFVELPVNQFSPNGHLFYLLLKNSDERDALIAHLKYNNILAVFHYQCLHNSPFYLQNHAPKAMPNAERYENCLLRLPVYATLQTDELVLITQSISSFFAASS